MKFDKYFFFSCNNIERINSNDKWLLNIINGSTICFIF